MYLSMLVAVAVLGQTVGLGREDGLEAVRPMVAVSATPGDLIAWHANRYVLSGADRTIPVCFLAYGTKALKVRRVELTRKVGDETRHEPGACVRILEGPLDGALVFVRTLDLHDTIGRPGASVKLPGEPVADAIEDVAGWRFPNGSIVPVFASTSVRDLGKTLDSFAEAKEEGLESAVPVEVLNLGNGTRIKVISETKIPCETEAKGFIPGLTVRVLSGPASGRNLVICKSTLKSEFDKALTAVERSFATPPKPKP